MLLGERNRYTRTLKIAAQPNKRGEEGDNIGWKNHEHEHEHETPESKDWLAK